MIDTLDENQRDKTTVISFAAPATDRLPAAQLKPKEHGAYAILAIPILTSILSTGPTVVGSCIAVAAVTGFLAHEPLLVAIGHRGMRTQRNAPGAIKRLAVLLTLTLVCGLVALLLGDSQVRMALVACAVLAVLSFAVAIAGQHKTLPSQLLGVVGLSIPCLPMLLAGGIETSKALEVWGTWLIGFTSTTIAVRSVIASQKRQSRLFHTAVLTLITLAVLSATLSSQFLLPLAAAPMLLMSWILLGLPPPAKHLKRVGWTLVSCTMATALWMAIAQ